MVIGFGSRKSTRDVDVVACSVDRETLTRLAQRVAKDACLPDSDPDVIAFSASLTELFAERRGEQPPTWTKEVEPSPRSHYLIKTTSDRKRAWLRKRSPFALRRRYFYAPPNYLMSA